MDQNSIANGIGYWDKALHKLVFWGSALSIVGSAPAFGLTSLSTMVTAATFGLVNEFVLGCGMKVGAVATDLIPERHPETRKLFYPPSPRQPSWSRLTMGAVVSFVLLKSTIPVTEKVILPPVKKISRTVGTFLEHAGHMLSVEGEPDEEPGFWTVNQRDPEKYRQTPS